MKVCPVFACFVVVIGVMLLAAGAAESQYITVVANYQAGVNGSVHTADPSGNYSTPARSLWVIESDFGTVTNGVYTKYSPHHPRMIPLGNLPPAATTTPWAHNRRVALTYSPTNLQVRSTLYEDAGLGTNVWRADANAGCP